MVCPDSSLWLLLLFRFVFEFTFSYLVKKRARLLLLLFYLYICSVISIIKLSMSYHVPVFAFQNRRVHIWSPGLQVQIRGSFSKQNKKNQQQKKHG
jgi:hypothetical protein